MNKPPLVLHICCAPDEAWVVNTLEKHYNLFCFFCNPNISPQKEYQFRLQEAQTVANRFNVPFFSDPYQPDSWEKAIEGFENTPEGGERCKRCFLLRLGRTAEFCRKMNLPSFTTVMSISPHKKISLLNETGKIAASNYDVNYECFDFKKKERISAKYHFKQKTRPLSTGLLRMQTQYGRKRSAKKKTTGEPLEKIRSWLKHFALESACLSGVSDYFYQKVIMVPKTEAP